MAQSTVRPAAASRPLQAPGFIVQDEPRIYSALLPGKWLLDRSTPSWRVEDPERGFQRIVKEDRARQIAINVLEQGRTFPNAIVLATDRPAFELKGSNVTVPADTRFMVVDGQHRLWAQHFSEYEASYTCLVHTGLSEVEMAKLFLEINDNQKRVPSSLRWDLVRLVRPEDDPAAIAATEIIYTLATDEDSPLYQRIDLTGEQQEIQLKQGSLAPDLRSLLSKRSALYSLPFDVQFGLIVQFFIALRERDPDGWSNGRGVFYKARVVRALLRLLPDMVLATEIPPDLVTFQELGVYLDRVDEDSLDPDTIRAAQGNAGIKAIHDQLEQQMFPARKGE